MGLLFSKLSIGASAVMSVPHAGHLLLSGCQAGGIVAWTRPARLGRAAMPGLRVVCDLELMNWPLLQLLVYYFRPTIDC